MPRTSIQHPPKYGKHKATGQAVVTLNGQDHYLGKYRSAASRKEYDRLITLWVQGGGKLPCGSQEEVTVTEVMAAYLAFAKSYYRKDGKITREYGLTVEACKVIKPLYGRAAAVEFGPLALKTVRQSFIESDISRKHVNKQVDRIKRMFKWAAAEEMIPSTVSQALSMVTGLRKGRTEARETAPILPVDDATVDATIPYLPIIPADMVRFQRLTSCRPAEVCKLRPCDLNRSEDVWKYKPESHKTEHHGRDRTIFVGPKAQGVLLRYLARDAQTHCFRPCDSEAKRLAEQEANRKTPRSCGNVRGSNVKQKPKRKPGEKYTTDTYRQVIQRACDKAFPHPQLSKLKAREMTDQQKVELRQWQKEHHWCPNRLRHTAATEIRSKFGLEAAQIILGHSQANVTQVYAERDIAKGVEVAKRIG
ncbi:MAG: site-specific integrase [Pirellulales bacterium]